MKPLALLIKPSLNFLCPILIDSCYQYDDSEALVRYYLLWINELRHTWVMQNTLMHDLGSSLNKFGGYTKNFSTFWRSRCIQEAQVSCLLPETAPV
jgi:hypothetical protein